MTSEDIREMSFQNVLDNILTPAGVHVGGYPEELFIGLEEEQREKWNCNVCFLVVREARECANKHLFCHTCIFAWSLTYGENSQRCPMCRSEQRSYMPNKEVDRLLSDQRVKCPEEGCTFRAPLRIFLMHSHGRQRYGNNDVDLESLRPTRGATNPAQLIVLPGGIALSNGSSAAGELLGGVQRAANIREQLQQGRAMIHQMMLLLHLEMQLRQQALVGYSQAHDPATRMRRLDEVLALNEQLNEVGTILSALLSSPLASRVSQTRVLPPGAPRRVDVSRDVMLSRGAGAPPPRVAGIARGPNVATSALSTAGPAGVTQEQPRRGEDNEDDDDDDDEEDETSESDATSVSSVPSVIQRRRGPHFAGSNTTAVTDGGTGLSGLARTELSRPQRRSEIRQQLVFPRSQARNSTSSEETSPRTRQGLASLPSVPPIAASAASTTQASSSSDSSSSSSSSSSTASTSNTGGDAASSQAAVSVTLQRLDSRVSTSQASESSPREGRSQLPPLNVGSSVSQQVFAHLGRGTPRAGGNQHLPTPDLPTLPSRERTLQSPVGNNSEEEEEQEEGEEGEHRTSSRAHEQFGASGGSNRLSLTFPLDGHMRGPCVTSRGVTASGAVYSTSADTPLTRAAHARHQTVPSANPAVLAGQLAHSRDSSRRRSSTTVAEETTGVPSVVASTAARGAAVTGGNAGTEGEVARSISRGQMPARRLRTDPATTAAPSQSTGRRNSGPTGAAQVAYVPARGTSPSRAARQMTRRQSGGGGVPIASDPRATHPVRRDDGADSVVRRAARGSVTAGRSSTNLPTTAGQLLRARRRAAGGQRPSGGGGGGGGGGGDVSGGGLGDRS